MRRKPDWGKCPPGKMNSKCPSPKGHVAEMERKTLGPGLWVQEGLMWDEEGKGQEGLLGHTKEQGYNLSWETAEDTQTMKIQHLIYIFKDHWICFWRIVWNEARAVIGRQVVGRQFAGQAGHDGGWAKILLVQMENSQLIQGLFWVWNDRTCWQTGWKKWRYYQEIIF